MTVAYPLHWPHDFPRTKSPISSRFKVSVTSALSNVQDELRRFGNDSGKTVTNLVVSSNFTLTDQRPKDGGIACYFRWDNMDCCIAIDRYLKPEENLQAVAHIIDAERTKLRHGGLNIVRASFRGFTALPPPEPGKQAVTFPWWRVLGFDAEPAKLEDAETAYRKMVKLYHPDSNPNTEPAKFNQVVDAIRQAREILK